MNELTPDEKGMMISVIDFRIEKLGEYKTAMTADNEKVDWAERFINKLKMIKEKLQEGD